MYKNAIGAFLCIYVFMYLRIECLQGDSAHGAAIQHIVAPQCADAADADAVTRVAVKRL